MMSENQNFEYITSVTPSKIKLRLYKIFFLFFGSLGRFLLNKKFNKIEIEGLEHLKSGPKLLLMNHSCPLDPVLITFFGRQPLQFLITEAFMQGSLASRIASLFGQIAKRKLDYDPMSIKLMKQWSDCGGIVAMFPEGKFSWDGKTTKLMPGIDQLIHYLNIPVVTVHLANGEKVKPAWALKARKTSIKIIINPPKVFKKEDNVQLFIEENIFNKNSNRITFPSIGDDLAFGLKKELRFCPYCSEENGLFEFKNELGCKSCNKKSIVKADNQIISDSFSNISDLFNQTYLSVDKLWQDKNEISSLNEVTLFDISKKNWKYLLKSIMIINKENIIIGNSNIKLSDITGHTIDWGDLIIIKTKYERFALKLPGDSRAVFTHILNKVVAGV
jgi:1-acyl-sn-glycerol-3-phosphate acyltransferase